MTNETLETIKSRRSCRAYKPEQITNEELDAVLEAGTYAASAMGRQSAKIVVVQDAAARILGYPAADPKPAAPRKPDYIVKV